MAQRIYISGDVDDGDYDSEQMSADFPDLLIPSFVFTDIAGDQVIPSAGKVMVSVSVDGNNYINVRNYEFNASEAYLSDRQIPAFSGIAIKCRITLSGIVGATSFMAIVWRGESDQILPVTISANGNERLKVDVGQTGFWDGREFRTGIDKTAAYTLKIVAPIDFILELQTLFSHDGTATFNAYNSEQVSSESTPFNDAIQVLPNNGMSTTPLYTRQTLITGGGSITLNGPQVPREYIKVVTATSTAQRSTVGGDSIKERGLPADTYYLVFTGTNYSYRLIFEERP